MPSPALPPSDHILIAGASGYLGSFVTTELCHRANTTVTALVGPTTSPSTIQLLEAQGATVKCIDASQPSALRGVCSGVTAVVSCMAASPSSGLTAQIDRDANIALFNDALAAGTCRHFMLVATYEGREAKASVTMQRYKEAAVEHVIQGAKESGMHWNIVRPTAYMKDFTDMPWEAVRKPGRKVIVPGSGTTKYNPIHGKELATFMCNTLLNPNPLDQEICIGGPEALSFLDVVYLAADVLGIPRKDIKVRHVPIGIAQGVMWGTKVLGLVWSKAKRFSEAMEFLVYAATHDSIGMKYGKVTVKEYYEDKLKEEG